MPDLSKTENQFEAVILHCREIFLAKMRDYGTAWRILRTSSLTDQIYIKAQRIRSIEEKIGREVNYTLYSKKEFEVKSKEKGGFLNIVAQDKTISLKG